MNKKAQFTFGPGPRKKKRVTPTKSEKNEIWDRQDGQCSSCGERLSPTTSEYHHKDGDRSNWRLSNITLVCVKCHKIETNKQRVRKVHAKRKEKETKENDPFGLSGGGLFGTQKPKKKQSSPFGGSSIFGPPKRKSRKKGPFDF